MDQQSISDPKAKWNRENAMDRTLGNTTPPSYPNEGMVKIFSTAYYSQLFSPLIPGQTVIDVGCAWGNNLIYFIDRGLHATGVDVTNEMVEIGQQNLERLGYKAHIVQGENENIPFPNNSFDVLISTAALHYSSGRSAINKALAEFSRVTKKGGKIFITTAGPNHEIRAKAIKHDDLLWEVQEYGFRSGDSFGFFDNQQHLEETCSQAFTRVETGVLVEQYSTRTLEFLYALCIN
jgi:ubiquinone/menaquinone biosynthesis C-methylase UbiE